MMKRVIWNTADGKRSWMVIGGCNFLSLESPNAEGVWDCHKSFPIHDLSPSLQNKNYKEKAD
jgi:hypothetical protein